MYSVFDIYNLINRLHNPMCNVSLEDLDTSILYTIIIEEYEDYTKVIIEE